MFRLLSRFCLAPLMAVCLLLLSPAPASAISMYDMAKDVYEGIRGPEQFSPAFAAGVEMLRRGDTQAGLSALLASGLKGDIPCLAFVLAYAQTEERGRNPAAFSSAAPRGRHQ